MPTIFGIPRNNVSAKVGGAGYTAGSGTLVLSPGGGVWFPALVGSNFYRVTVIQAAFATSPLATEANYTIFKVTAVSGDTLTLDPTPLEGTTDRSYAAGDLVEIRITAGSLSDIHAAVNTLENAGYAADNTVVHLTGDEHISGYKTFDTEVTLNHQEVLLGKDGTSRISVPGTGAGFYVRYAGDASSYFDSEQYIYFRTNYGGTGGTRNTVVADPSGNVGIMRWPSYRLDVDGIARATQWLVPTTVADSVADYRSIYQSTDNGKLCFKDENGVVHELY